MKPVDFVFPPQVRALLLAMIYVALVGLFSIALLLVLGRNELAEHFADYTRNLVQQHLNAQESTLGRIVTDYSVWDEAYQNLSVRFNLDWARSNLTLQDVVGNDSTQVVLIDRDGALHFKQPAAPYLFTKGAAEPLKYLLRRTGVMNSGKQYAATHAYLDGHFYVLAVSQVLPSTLKRAADEKPLYLLASQLIDSASLRRAEAQLGIHDLRLDSRFDRSDGQRISLLLQAADGRYIGMASWQQPDFAGQLLARYRWLLLATLLAMLLSSVLLWYRFYQTVHVQEEESSRLRLMEGRFRDIVEMEFDWVWETDAEHRITYLPAQIESYFNRPLLSVAGRKIYDLMDEESRQCYPEFYLSVVNCFARQQDFSDLIFRFSVGGVQNYFTVRARAQFDAHGRFAGYRGICKNITSQRESDLRSQILTGLYRESQDAIVQLAGDFTIERANPAFSRLTGIAEEAAEGMSILALKPKGYGGSRLSRVRRELRQRQHWRGEVSLAMPAQGTRIMSVSVFSIQLEFSARPHYVAIAVDVTAERNRQQLIWQQANFDSLTQLANRMLLLDRMKLELREVKRQHSLAALLFIDIDGFKAVNDQLGHDAGDQLLVQISQRLGEAVRSIDTVARYGGDEFVILLRQIQQPGNAERAARGVLDRLEQPFEVKRRLVEIGASIGIAYITAASLSPEQVLGAADHAMYRAKAAGKHCYRVAD